MCLTTVTERINNPKPEITKAYKEFAKEYKDGKFDTNGTWIGGTYTDRLKFPFFSLGRNEFVTKGKWLKAIPTEIKSSNKEMYTTGFHCYENPPLNINLTPVYVCNIGTKGVQHGENVIVAQYLYVPEGNEVPELPEELVPAANDMLGNVLVVGDFVSYPVRQGSNNGTKVGRIKGIVKNKHYSNNELHPILKVQSVERNWESKFRLQKEAPVVELNRVVKVPTEYVTQNPDLNKLFFGEE